jgi:hypothetical protein
MDNEPIGEFIENGTKPIGKIIDVGNDGEGSDAGNREPEREIIEGIPTIDPITLGEWSDSAAYTDTDTRTGSAEPTPITTGRRRGRPPGTRNKTKESTSADLDLKGLIYSAHLAVAAVMNIEELCIDESEAKKLQDAILRMQKVYPTLGLTEKQMAWGNLICVASSVYVPRAVSIWKRSETQPQQPKAQKSPTPIRPHTAEPAPLTNPSQIDPNGGGVDGTIQLGF